MKKLLWVVLWSGCAGAPDLVEEPVPVVTPAVEAPVDAGRPGNHFLAVSRIECGAYCHHSVIDFVGRKAEGAPTRDLVVPGKPEESFLMMKLLGTHVNLPECAGTPSPCGKQMPAGGKISADDLENIRAWILEGAPTTHEG